MKRLLVDARPLTHPTARGRGIGNHVAGILEGLAAVAAPATALISDEDARAVVPPAFPAGDVEVLARDVVRRFAEPGTWFLATSLYLHPISLDPIPRSVTDARLPVAALLYDVIPYRYPEQYLRRDDPARQARLRRLWAHTVDVHLANSAFVATTAVDELGIDPAAIRVVGASANARFTPAPSGEASPLERPYVVSITGEDPRKNTEGLLRGWAAVSPGVRRDTALVVVASPSRATLDAWRALATELGVADSVRFATGLADGEVVRLLQHAALDVVPATEEGFGLPVLEAAACGAPVVCSGTSSLPEVLGEPLAHFDPLDPASIAHAIERGLTDPAQRAVLRRAAEAAVARWRWDRVVGDIVAAVEKVDASGRTRHAVTRPAPWYAVVGVPGDGLDERVRRLRTAEPDAHVVAAVDTRGTPGRAPFDGATVPAGALGRYVKRHEFDRIDVAADG